MQWVEGAFDPLLAAHVRRLRECANSGQLLVVAVTNPPNPLLSQRARAELVAALAMVDSVVLEDGRTQNAADAAITGQFVDHVLQRHRQEQQG